MTENIGMKELTKHLVYLNEKQGLEGIHRAALSTLAFVALGVCYKHGYDINYDYVFEKSSYGATNDRLRREMRASLNRRIDQKEAKELQELSTNKELDRVLNNIIKKSDQDMFVFVPEIRSHELYEKDEDIIDEIYESKMNVLNLPLWTKAEIIKVFNPENEKEVDSRIPLNKHQYSAMKKYMDMSILKENDRRPFSIDELLAFHGMPYHLIRSVEENGCYVKES